MELNQYTNELDASGATSEEPPPPRNRRSALTWGAVAAAGVAVAAFSVTTLTGGDHDGVEHALRRHFDGVDGIVKGRNSRDRPELSSR